jgi:hypothetical protein
MLRRALLSLTALAALAAPAIAGNHTQAGLPTSSQPCAMHSEGKLEGRAVGGRVCNADSDVPRSDGTMRNGLLPNPSTYG